jgi:hypothetical protein
MSFLCDECAYDWRSTCHNPKRPNVTSDEGCKDFKLRYEIPSPEPPADNPFDPDHPGYYKGEWENKHHSIEYHSIMKRLSGFIVRLFRKLV